MVKRDRIKIGILFNFTKSWLGGVYYIQNIIKALNVLEDDLKPEILIFYNTELKDFTKNIDYPYYSSVYCDFPSIYFGYLKSWLLQKNIFVETITKEYNLDGVYPLYEHPVKNRGKELLVAWFPDLQHKFYPQYFSKINLFLREIRIKMILRNSDKLVVSSVDVKNHFYNFYKIPQKLKIHVLPFVSIIDDFQLDNFNELKSKYKIPEKYFMVSNQFYEHKNHITIVKALKLFKKQKFEVNIVMTGKMEDYRNPKYIQELKNSITDDISGMINFLGVIPREHQLCIMKNSLAVIQPSLFEGWSTVIEDAKSLGVPVISSDIEVHKEQLGDKGRFFNSKSPESLASVVKLFLTQSSNNQVIYEDYQKRVLDFAKNFISVFFK